MHLSPNDDLYQNESALNSSSLPTQSQHPFDAQFAPPTCFVDIVFAFTISPFNAAISSLIGIFDMFCNTTSFPDPELNIALFIYASICGISFNSYSLKNEPTAFENDGNIALSLNLSIYALNPS